MSIVSTLNKTNAEQALIDGFEAAAPGLPGSGWVDRLRRSALQAFAAEGLPHRRIEEWKYTDLRERLRTVAADGPERAPARVPDRAAVEAALGPLAGLQALRVVLVDGRIVPELSDLATIPSGIELKPLGAQLAKSPSWLEGKFDAARIPRRDPIAALNLAYMTDGLLLKVTAGTALAAPVVVANLRTPANAALLATRHIVSVEAGARLTLIEAHGVLGAGNTRPEGQGAFATDIDIADGARLDHIQVLDHGAGTHLAQWRARIAAGASYRAFQLTAGAALARNELAIDFTGPDAHLDVSGAFLGRNSDHIDTTLVVDHSTTGCTSRELFHGVLEDRARGVFQGKVIVRPEAQKTDGKQMARALMLSPDAEFDSKPELEIYADDVACGHGSTAAEIDADALFYLRSRGIPLAEARAMLIESFVGEALEKVEDEPLREALRTIARGWLADGRPVAKTKD